MTTSFACAGVFLVAVNYVVAQATPSPETCYSAGSIAGAVVGTLLVTLFLLAAAFAIWKFYWRGRRGKHLVLVTDAEGGADQYAFDNPCFRDGTPIGRSTTEKEPVKLDQKARWSAWSPIGALVSNRNDKRRALDDSFVGEPQVQTVSLRSRDFTGLGFNICGNMRDGIFVKDVLHRGPASESGRIAPGDRIDSIRISFRHMVFEDALTILSYASPYEVQLEVENAAASRPSTLIRTKRTSASNIAPADRICHPFYRSQSIADLAQIGKASLKRVQQMGGGINTSPRMMKSDPFDDSATGDYPTLKLSSSSPIPTQNKKENSRLEKTAAGASPPGSAVVKPERAKRVTSKGPTDSPEDSEGRSDTLSRFQKFGVRVLPDPAVPRPTSEVSEKKNTNNQQGNGTRNHNTRQSEESEAEHHQNEQNTMRERVGSTSTSNTPPATNFFPGQGAAQEVSEDTVDTGRPSVNPFHYDERGIDIGPMETQHSNSSAPDQSADEVVAQSGKLVTKTIDEETDTSKENNVKQMLSRGLHNLKEKLHHDRRKSSSSPEPTQSAQEEININKKQTTQKQGRSHSTFMSSDIENVEAERLKENGTRGKINPKDEPEKRAERRRQRNPDKDGATDKIPLPPDDGIPTEIPEEVSRAAMAAWSNRKSLCSANLSMPDSKKENTDAVQSGRRESISDSSSDCDVAPGIASDSLGRPPKRSNKRKAPPPPPEDIDSGMKSPLSMAESWLNKSHVKDTDEIELEANLWQGKSAGHDTLWTKESSGNPNSSPTNSVHSTSKTSSEPGKIITTFANMARQRNNLDPAAKDITNITIADGSSHILSTFTSRRSTEGNEVAPNPVDSSSSGTSTMETKTVDYDEGLHVHTMNYDSDSDLERLEGDDDGYDVKRTKKGGTTIELNSSHITIHHSPSSDTVQMATELESDSTRKAASLGDLSRLDSEQPMSILERAVSLDLADGGTPHGSKKRKAPLPPPGEDYLTTVQDGEEGTLYRKEPRLDNAMDTFQRRRLKKSSDWGTMEEALRQTEGTLSSYKIEASHDISHMDVDISKLQDMTSNVSDVKQGTETRELGNDDIKLSSVLAHRLKNSNSPITENLSRDASSSSCDQKLTDNGHPVQSTVSSNLGAEDHSISFSSTQMSLPEEIEHAEIGVPKDNVQKQKMVLHISRKSNDQMSSSANVGISSSMSQVTIVPTSSLMKTDEHSEHDSTVSTAQQQQRDIIQSSEHHTSSIVSSTPLPKRESICSLESKETVQSPLVTSSDAGISSIHVVSSSMQDMSVTPSEMDSNILVTSATDPFVTATSTVDSTTSALADILSDDESTWSQDLQPPELPTSPVPVINQGASSSFTASPSMTYITEIQVVTTTDNENENAIDSSNLDHQSNSSSLDATNISSTFTKNVHKFRSDSSLSSDSITSDGDDKDIDTTLSNLQMSAKENTSGHASRNNVTVTAIRTSALTGSTDKAKILTNTEVNSGQSAMVASDGTSNHIVEKRAKPARPPVPPRKSESSSMSSTITVEVPKVRSQQQLRLAETASSSLLAGGSVSEGSPGGKFISFSSLTPRSDSGTARHSSSFEQWVFLDETSNNTSKKLNGLENPTSAGLVSDSSNVQHSSVMTRPGTGPGRSQTVTHIILDTKQNTGGQVKQ